MFIFGEKVECVCPACGAAYSSMTDWIRTLGYQCPDCKKRFVLGDPETTKGERFTHANLIEEERCKQT